MPGWVDFAADAAGLALGVKMLFGGGVEVERQTPEEMEENSNYYTTWQNKREKLTNKEVSDRWNYVTGGFEPLYITEGKQHLKTVMSTSRHSRYTDQSNPVFKTLDYTFKNPRSYSRLGNFTEYKNSGKVYTYSRSNSQHQVDGGWSGKWHQYETPTDVDPRNYSWYNSSNKYIVKQDTQRRNYFWMDRTGGNYSHGYHTTTKFLEQTPTIIQKMVTQNNLGGGSNAFNKDVN